VGKKITYPKCIPEGPVSLAGVGSRRSLDYLREHVPTSRMPGYGEDRISDKDLRALASLKQ
jgi:hypothetical protein